MKLVIAALLCVALVGCQPATKPGPAQLIPSGCGLPTPRPNAELKGLPEEFLIEDVSELVRVQRRPGGIVAAINLALGVTPAWEEYKEASKAAGFELVGDDNEGFEAEIYLRSKEQLGAVQIRISTCDDASIAFVSIVSIDELGSTPFPMSPTPGKSPPKPGGGG